MRITTRLYLIFLLPVFVFFIVALLYFSSLNKSKKFIDADEFTDDFIINMNRLEVHTAEFIQFKYPRMKQQWYVVQKKLAQRVKKIEVNSEHEKVLKNSLESRIAILLNLFNRLVENSENRKKPGFRKALADEMDNRIGGQLVLNISSCYADLLALKSIYNNEVERQEHYISNLLMVFAGVFIYVAINIVLLLRKNITEPVNNLVLAVRQLAEGNLGHSIKITGRDELGILAEEFNTMAVKLLHADYEIKAALQQAQHSERELDKLNVGLEKRVKERTSELMIANEDLESFAFSVAHDLRTPLRGIDGFSHVLLKEYSEILDEDAQHCLNQIRKEAQHMGEIIDALSLLSSISRNELQPEAVDISALAKDITDLFCATEPHRNVRISIMPGMIAKADKKLMLLLLENILANAWKYTGKKDQATIEVGVEHTDKGDVFYIKDNGCGFDMQYADKVFLPFHRLHNAIEYTGSGVGLATAQKIIVRHQGRIWVESEIGKGTTVFFTLAQAES